MRVLLLPASYSPVVGGLQTVVHGLARALDQKGHQVCVATNKFPRRLQRREQIDGINVRRLHFLSPRHNDIKRGRLDLFLASLYCSPATRFELARIVRTFSPDVVNVHYPDAQTAFVPALHKRFDFKLAVSLHGYDVERFSSDKISNERERKNFVALLGQADVVTACSSYLLDQARKLEPSVVGKGRVVANGIDRSRFADKLRHLHPRPYVLAAGRLTHAKGFDLLLTAFSQLNGRTGETDLIIAGEGELRETLKRRVRELGLTQRVHFFGNATPDEIVRLLNGSLFMVVPSREEAFGVAALEAMAAGKPVLATRVGGLPEFLVGSANKLVQPSIAGLQSGLTDWLERRDTLSSLGKENLALAAKYTWESTAEEYLDAYAAGLDS
ncbi:MAG TPA: glycosyltransferase family 4 protein [Pyrinomonadaceae bacterium]|jgi:glycosyltransferase involved in cell wall biosynthesis